MGLGQKIGGEKTAQGEGVILPIELLSKVLEGFHSIKKVFASDVPQLQGKATDIKKCARPNGEKKT